ALRAAYSCASPCPALAASHFAALPSRPSAHDPAPDHLSSCRDLLLVSRAPVGASPQKTRCAAQLMRFPTEVLSQREPHCITNICWELPFSPGAYPHRAAVSAIASWARSEQRRRWRCL